MSTSSLTITELDGSQLYYSIVSGAKRIFEHQKLLNKINVFPVPDADTGTNLASTMRSILDAKIPVEDVRKTATAIADAAISGARGNSGIIFAQFLYGFSNELKERGTMDVKAFAESMKKAVTYAYDAIANPVEGTILTVIKEWADHIYDLKDMIDDFVKLLEEAYIRAVQSLSETTEKLSILAKTHVVDAGAKGFVYFLEGIRDFFLKGETAIGDMEVLEEDAIDVHVEDIHEEITFRYCTEAMISGNDLNKKRIQSLFNTCGDSLVIAGSPTKMRIHIHTDHPAKVFSRLNRFGHITYQKVDDMVMQQQIMHHRKHDIAILTDSTCDLPQELLEEHQIHMMPLSVHFGESFFLDRITMQPPEFYEAMKHTDERPSTSQPTIKDFQNKFEYLASHYQSTLGFFISDQLSGTYQNGRNAASEVSRRTSKKANVYSSKSLSGGLGLLVLRAARALADGATEQEILDSIETWTRKSRLFATVPTLKYIIQSGRVSPVKSFVARTLNLKPIITVNEEGASQLFGKSLTYSGLQKNLLKTFRKLLLTNEVWEYAITHAENETTASYYAAELEKITGKPPLYISHISPVLVANTGPGIVAVSMMLK